MKKIIFVYLLSFITIQLTIASPVGIDNSPTVSVKNAHAIIEKARTEFEVKSASEAIEKQFLRVTILNEKSDLNELVIHYNSFSKVKNIEAKLYDSNKKIIKKYKSKEVKDYSAVSGFSIYDDSRVKYLNVEHNRYPYTIEFSYEITYSGIRSYPDWNIQPFNTAVKLSSYKLILPQGYQAHFQPVNTNIEPNKSQEADQLIYRWFIANQPAIIKEDYAPNAFEILPKVVISPVKFKIDGYEGSMSSWESFSNFMYQLWDGKDQLSPKMIKKVHSLTENLTSDKEKIASLYCYLQHNMRYVSVQLGIGGWQPFDANYVEQNKYGDCKALTNFMKAMLKEIGIESYPALINNGGADQGLNLDFAYPRFNHVILYIPTEKMWLECTSKNTALGFIGQSNSNRKVLLVQPNGGTLITTPVISPEENHLQTEAKIQLHADGQATLTVLQKAAASQQQAWLRYAKDNLGKEELEDNLQEQTTLASSSFQDIEIVVQKDKPLAELTYTAVVNRYSSKAGKRLFVPINCINTFKRIPKEQTDRIFPVVKRSGFSDEGTYIFDLPVGYQVESCPTEPILVNSKFGIYSLTCEQQNNQLIIHRKLKITPFEVAADQYDAFRDFFKSVAKADSGKLVLVKM